MPRIVSGADEFNPDAALLRGTAIGREWGKAQNEKDEEQRKQMMALLEFHQEATKVKKAESDALEKHAQGKKDAQALATHAALIERQKLNPRFRAVVERKGLVEKTLKGMAERGVSEDTIQRVIQHVKGAEDSLRQKDQDEQFEQFLGGFEGHAAVTPEDVEGARAQASQGGNRAAISKGLIDKSNKAAADATFTGLNLEEFEKASQFAQTLPPGLQRAQAFAALNAYKQNPKLQATPGSGGKLFQAIQGIAMGKTDEDYKRFKEAQDAATLERPALGMGGATVGQMRQDVGENVTTLPGWVGEAVDYIPFAGPGNTSFGGPDLGRKPLGADYQAYASGLRGQLEQRYPGQTGQRVKPQAGGASDMPQVDMVEQQLAQIEAGGLDMSDPEAVARFLAALEGGAGAPPGR